MVKDSHDRKEPRRPRRVVVEQQRRLDLLPCESTAVGYKSNRARYGEAWRERKSGEARGKKTGGADVLRGPPLPRPARR
jgi:hypothetical protein